MLTFPLILTLINLKLISGVENSDDKLINLLAEKQKKEFLQIEERIEKVPNVKSPEDNDKNFTLYEQRLDAQEIDNINRRNVDAISSVIDKEKLNNNNEDELHIDLTLRSSKKERKKRAAIKPRQIEGTNEKKGEEHIPVSVKYDDEKVNKGKRSTNSTMPRERSDSLNLSNNKPEVQEITWNNISIATKTVNLNSTPTSRIKRGNESNVTDITLTNKGDSKKPRNVDNNSTDHTVNHNSTDKLDAYENGTTENGVNTTNQHTPSISEPFSPTTEGIGVTTANHSINPQTDNEDVKKTPGNIAVATGIIDGSKSFNYTTKPQKEVNISPTINNENPKLNDRGLPIQSVQVKTTFTIQPNVTPQAIVGVGITTQYPNLPNDAVEITTMKFKVITAIDDLKSVVYPKNTDVMPYTNNTTVSNLENSSDKADTKINDFDYNTTSEKSNESSKNASGSKVKVKTNDTIADGVQSNSITVVDSSTDAVDSNFNVTTDTVDDSTPNNLQVTEAVDSSSKYQNVTTLNTNKTIDNVPTITDSVFDNTKPVNNVSNNDNKGGTTVIIDGESTQNVVGSTSSGYDNASAHDGYHSTKVESIDTITTTLLGDANSELNDKHQSTNINNVKTTTDHLVGSTTIGNLDAIKNNQPSTTKQSDINVEKDNLTDVKHKINYDNKFKNTALPGSSPKQINSDDQRKTLQHFNFSWLENKTVYHVYKIDLNQQTQDPQNNKDMENQPQYAPVHIYDPENAYFNAFNYQGPNSNDDEDVSGNISVLVKKAETNSKSNKVDIYDLSPQTNSRIKDVEQEDSSSSNTKDEVNSDLYNVLSQSDLYNLLSDNIKITGVDSSEPDTHLEQPTKHNLKKLRQILFNRFGPPSKLYSNFKKQSTEDTSDTDSEVYNDVVNSLKKHNEKIQDADISDVIEKLEKIQNHLDKKKKYKSHKPNNIKHQSRFQVKHRNAKKNKPLITIDEEPEDKKSDTKKSKALVISDKYLELHANILKQLVEKDDVGLEKYDWLGTTVMIRAGIAKLQDIIEKIRHHQRVHLLDHELLQLVIELHKTAVKVNTERDHEDVSRRSINGESFEKIQFIFGSKKRDALISFRDIESFDWSLNCLLTCLNDLHRAIKQISRITNYKQQRWFRNIKDLYLKSGGEKEYLEVLLHLVTAKLVNMLDDISHKMVGPDKESLKRNMALERVGVEFELVVRICNQLVEINNGC